MLVLTSKERFIALPIGRPGKNQAYVGFIEVEGDAKLAIRDEIWPVLFYRQTW